MGQKAVIYARVSTSDQSCERQIGELTSFAERGDFEIVGVLGILASARTLLLKL
ncbi:recombinase family protein [Kiloniella spongiae]|uniref:recombinase family protein n=1 Tax=Kiloniella spongiae TaxID=1489064 RepID=UPI0009E59335|nr:recombinase family protein [Kiloniella spongiae]